MQIEIYECERQSISIEFFADKFHATVGGCALSADSSTKLKAAIKKAVREKPLSIPAITMVIEEDRGKVHVEEHTIIGIHATHDNLMVRDGFGRVSEHRSWHELMRPVTKEELREFKVILKQRAALNRTITKWLEDRSIDGKALVKAARERQMLAAEGAVEP